VTLTTNFDKTRKDIEKKIADAAPLEALVGAGDFAVEKLRSARAEISSRIEGFDPKGLVESLQADVKSAPEQAKELPSKAQAVVSDVLTTVVSAAVSTYSDLAGRGETLMTRVRGQQATRDLEDQLDATVVKVKAASTTAKKSAAATTSSAKATRTTAKKSAAKTKTAAKSAATSAKKSASAAKKAAEAAADQVGD
jgi:heparin binding hemagglutinin HbhA